MSNFDAEKYTRESIVEELLLMERHARDGSAVDGGCGCRFVAGGVVGRSVGGAGGCVSGLGRADAAAGEPVPARDGVRQRSWCDGVVRGD